MTFRLQKKLLTTVLNNNLFKKKSWYPIFDTSFFISILDFIYHNFIAFPLFSWYIDEYVTNKQNKKKDLRGEFFWTVVT